MSLEEDLRTLLFTSYQGSYYAATPTFDPTLPAQVIKMIEDSEDFLRYEDVVDDKTVDLVTQLVEQNKNLEAAATHYAEKVATTDFVTLDRDMWRRRCENLEQQIARESKS